MSPSYQISMPSSLLPGHWVTCGVSVDNAAIAQLAGSTFWASGAISKVRRQGGSDMGRINTSSFSLDPKAANKQIPKDLTLGVRGIQTEKFRYTYQ